MTPGISNNVIILTKDEYQAKLDAVYEEGRRRGRFDVASERHAAEHPYISPCPSGYDTILGYLAKFEPTRMELIDQDAEATQRDGWWCTHRANERRLQVHKVQAPPFLQEQGIETVNAYPTSLLAERFE